MRRSTYLFLGALALLVAGCGGTNGTNGTGQGDVAGVVFDTDGNVVRGARVFVDNPPREATSNSSGSYVLSGLPANDILIRADVTQDGITYVGQNLARVFGFDRAKNVNIVVTPQSQVARIHGTVTTSGGAPVSGARVFAIGENNLTSSMDITDGNGDYTIGRLAAGVSYEVSAGSADFRSDGTVITLSPTEDRDLDFTTDLVTGTGTLPFPANIDGVAWTSPDDTTRSVDAASAYEAIKRIYDPKRAQRASLTRLTPSGDIVEVDLTWDRVFSDFLLGYGIYRANGTAGTLVADDFLRDPLAEFYADTDNALNEGATYSYAITSVNTDRQESDFSDEITLHTLGHTTALSPSFDPLRFRWQLTSGAENYVVFLFDENPRVGVSPIWDNSATPATGSSLLYSGPALNGGQTYYYVVLGLANANTSRSISRIISFTA